jgi:hypothetical protein
VRVDLCFDKTDYRPDYVESSERKNTLRTTRMRDGRDLADQDPSIGFVGVVLLARGSEGGQVPIA